MVQLNLVKSLLFLIFCLSVPVSSAHILEKRDNTSPNGGRTGVGGGITNLDSINRLLLQAWGTYEKAAKEGEVNLLPMSTVIDISNLLSEKSFKALDLNPEHIIITPSSWNASNSFQRLHLLIMQTAMISAKSKDEAELVSCEFLYWLKTKPILAVQLSELVDKKL